MAHMCVKTGRLDVAEVCLSNMDDAKVPNNVLSLSLSLALSLAHTLTLSHTLSLVHTHAHTAGGKSSEGGARARTRETGTDRHGRCPGARP